MRAPSWCMPILGYHRVSEPKEDHVPTVTPEVFERQLRIIQQLGFRVLDLGEAVEALERGTVPPRRSVVITFDDGYEETCTVAAPLLHRFGFHATVFVPPIDIGRPGFMTWEQTRAVSRNGMSVGSHTLHHTYLPFATSDQIREELVQSKSILERELGRPVVWLSYPVGGFSPAVQEVVRQAGYRAACTTNRGTSRFSQDLFALRRIKMTQRDRHPMMLRVKLSGYYDLFRRLEPPA